MDHRTIAAGQRIKAVADRKGISIDQLSATTRMDVGMIRGVITGAIEPTVSHVFLIADALAVDVSVIIGARALHPEHLAGSMGRIATRTQ